MSRGLIGAGRYERSDERTTGATATATAPSTPASGRCNCASQSYGKGVVIRFQSTRLRQRAAARRLSARRNRLPSSVALCHVGVVARRIGAVIPIAGVGSGPVVAAVWVIIVGPAPSAVPPLWVIVIGPAPSTTPPAAEGGDDNKSTAEAMVIKSVEFAESVELTKMAVVESAGMKFMKPWLKRAGMKFVQPRVKPTAMEAEKCGAKSAAMEAGDAGVKSDAGETATMKPATMKPATMEPATMEPATMEPAANCEVRSQESCTED